MFYLTSVNNGENLSPRQLDGLIAQLAGQDIDALEELYHAISDKVYGYALSVVKNPQDAEDVLQDLFTVVYQSAAAYTSVGKPMAWLFTITRNLCLQRLRERKRSVGLPEPVGEAITADPGADHAVQTEEKMLLQACMEKLGDEERQVMVLHAVSGLKHREIAELMNLSLSAVLSKYHRSIKKIKQYLEGRV